MLVIEPRGLGSFCQVFNKAVVAVRLWTSSRAACINPRAHPRKLILLLQGMDTQTQILFLQHILIRVQGAVCCAYST